MTNPYARRLMSRLLVVAILTLGVAGLGALGSAACSTRVPTLEERAVALDRQLMCPICDGQTLDESQSQLAQQMKQVIREKLAQGETEDQIKAYFSSPDRYGPAVLAAPPASGFNLVLWALPPALTIVGLGGLFLLIRAMRVRSRPAGVRAGDLMLATYLEQVDRELGLAKGAPPPGSGPGLDPLAVPGAGEKRVEQRNG